MDFAAARRQMVENQIKTRDVKDPRVLAAAAKVPRHLFVPSSHQNEAYDDTPLPIGEEQTISQPYIVAYMTEALELTGDEKVLEIGTGSGYQSALLAELAREVFTVERIRRLQIQAEARLRELGYTNIQFREGDGTLGWPEEAPFDAIIVTAGAPQVPQPLMEQLAESGRLVMPVGPSAHQDLKKITRRENRLEEKDLGGCRFVKLVGAHGWEN